MMGQSSFLPVLVIITRVLGKVLWCIIHNGNRTGWSPIRSVVIRGINKIGRSRSGSLICQSRVWLQTELDDTVVLLPINHNHNNFPQKKIHLGQISPVRTMSKAKNLEIFKFSLQGKWLLQWLLRSILWFVDLAEWTY